MDGALRGWRIESNFAAFETQGARKLEVRELSVGSLEILLHLPLEVYMSVTVTALGATVVKIAKVLDAIKRIAGFPAEVKLQRTTQTAEQIEADLKLLQAADALKDAQAERHRRQLAAAGWELSHARLIDAEDVDAA